MEALNSADGCLGSAQVYLSSAYDKAREHGNCTTSAVNELCLELERVESMVWRLLGVLGER